MNPERLVLVGGIIDHAPLAGFRLDDMLQASGNWVSEAERETRRMFNPSGSDSIIINTFVTQFLVDSVEEALVAKTPFSWCNCSRPNAVYLVKSKPVSAAS